MFPIAKPALSLREISDYWSREIRPTASSNELLNLLASAWWLGDLRGDFRHSRLQLLKIMFTSKYRDDLGIVVVGDERGPPGVEMPDGSLEIDIRPQIRVPSSNTDSWDEAACRDAFHALAKVTKESSVNSYREFAVLLPSIRLTYEEFDAWRTKRGYSMPTFWQPRDQGARHYAGATSSAGSDNDASHGPQKKRKTWQAKRGEPLTASESAVLNAIIEIWPDGKIDHKAKARDERILSHLKNAEQHRVSTRTIQRTLKKILLR